MKKFLLLLLLLVISTVLSAQTNHDLTNIKSKLKNDIINKIATDEDFDKAFFMFGVMTLKTKYPERFNISSNPTQQGFTIGSRWNMVNVEEIPLSKIGRIELNLGGEFTLGFGMGEDNLDYIYSYDTLNQMAPIYAKYKVKHYTIVTDLFSMNINGEYHLKAFGNRGVVAGLALTFFNLGGTFTYMESKDSAAKYNEKAFGMINFIPFYIQPYGKLSLKGATLGIGLLINPYSFVEYRFGPKGFYTDEENGIKLNSTRITKYAIQLFLRF